MFRSRTSSSSSSRDGTSSRNAMILLVLVSTSLGAALTLALVRIPSSDVIPAGADPVATPISPEFFNDARSVELQTRLSAKREIHSSVGGTVTKFACRPGMKIASGSTLLEVDGVKRIALATARPLWRDIWIGTKGSDVKALQRELRRLGEDIKVSGRMDLATARAFNNLMARNRVSRDASNVDKASIIWLPDSAVQVESCLTQLGSHLSAEGSVAALRREVESLQVKNLPGDLYPGARLLDIDGVKVHANVRGEVTASAEIKAFVKSAAYHAFTDSGGAVPIRAQYRLVKAIDVFGVPPSAIIPSSSKRGCVVASSGEILPVEVVSSILGKSLVKFHQPPSVASVVLKPEDGTTCGS